MLVFDLGDRVEDAIQNWLYEADIPHIRPNESRDLVEVRPPGLRVRCDFFLEADGSEYWQEDIAAVPGDFPPPQKGEQLVGEVKSMSDYAFDRAKRGDIDIAYLCQMEVYTRAYNVKHALLIAYKKQTSHLCEVLYTQSEERWQWLCNNVNAARGDELPPRPYELEEKCGGCDGTGLTAKRKQPHKACSGTGKEPGGPFLPNFPCGYCGQKENCWGSLELTVNRAGQPRWKLVGEANP
jgi:hypothetical protein